MAEVIPAQPRSTRATIAVYALGIVLLVAAFFAQEATDAITFPRGVSPDAAGMIGGLSPIVILALCSIAWYRWFRGRAGSTIILVGGIALTKTGGALIARLLIVMLLPHT